MADPVTPLVIKKNYGSRLSLDLDTSLPGVSPEGALSLKNFVRRHGKGMSKRPGSKMVLSNEGRLADTTISEIWFGLHNYSYRNTSFGMTSQLMVIAGGTVLSILPIVTSTVTVSYAGAGTGTFELEVNSSGLWEATLRVAGVALSGWPKTYGDGLTTAASQTIATLVSNIAAEANWTATPSASNTSDSLVAQIGTVSETDAKTTPLVLRYHNMTEAVNQTAVVNLDNPGVDEDYANLKGINVANCMFFPGGRKTVIMKWDGQTFCRPGLPQASINAIADTGAGATHAAGNTYKYRVVYKRIDLRDNEIYGPYSDDSLAVAEHTVGGAPTNITITINTLQRSSQFEYEPRSAIVNGAQVAVNTITVDNTLTLYVGDEVYFYDGVTAAYVTRTVTAVAATTITVDGGGVTVADNDIISNIRVEIFRTENDGFDFYLLAEIPCDTINATQTYVDAITDANLGADLEEQNRVPSPPPNCTFMCVHQGLVVIACFDDDPNGFSWNDPEWGFEAFPQASNRDSVQGAKDEGITGIISESDNVLAIFKARSYFRIIGDLASNNYTIVEASQGDLGVPSHASLVKVNETVFGISQHGPITIENGVISLGVAQGVRDYFYDNEYTVTQGSAISSSDYDKLVVRRATGIHHDSEKRLLFFIPAEEGTFQTPTNTPGIRRYANENSLWLCYDLIEKEWREWSLPEDLNAHLAMEISNGELFFISTNPFVSGSPSRVACNYVWKFLGDESINNYVDNTAAIDWVVRLPWEAADNPSSFKKSIAMKLYALHTDAFLAAFTLTIKEYRDYKATVYTNTTRTFSASSDLEKTIKLAMGKFRAQSLEISNNVRYECPILSGIEVGYRIPYDLGIKDAQGD